MIKLDDFNSKIGFNHLFSFFIYLDLRVQIHIYRNRTSSQWLVNRKHLDKGDLFILFNRLTEYDTLETV